MQPTHLRTLVALLFALALVLAPRLGHTQDPAPADTAWQEVLVQARAGLEATKTSVQSGTAAPGDGPEWSQRLLEAEVMTGADPLQAHKAHLQRMERHLEDWTMRHSAGAAAQRDVISARYDVALARALLAEAETEARGE